MNIILLYAKDADFHKRVYLMTSIKEGLDAYNNEDYDKALNILSPLAEEGNLEA